MVIISTLKVFFKNTEKKPDLSAQCSHLEDFALFSGTVCLGQALGV
jgi:hypothetical protein